MEIDVNLGGFDQILLLCRFQVCESWKRAKGVLAKGVLENKVSHISTSINIRCGFLLILVDTCLIFVYTNAPILLPF